MDESTRQELRKKNLIYAAVLLSAVGIVFIYRNYIAPQRTELAITGVTFGVVPYMVKYIDESGRDFSAPIDSVLQSLNQALSTYVPNSEISRFNRDSAGIRIESPFFYPVLAASKEAYDATSGAFDPTVMPLVNAWGFGPEKGAEQKVQNIDSLKAFVGFNQIGFSQDSVWKNAEGIQLDFSAIAKGYGVDLVADLLLAHDVKDFLVEIGGEVVCRGRNADGEIWTLGINNPFYKETGGSFLSARVKLADWALATSGNYENYYVKDGKKYAHTISPATGYPVEHNLLSASVFAPTCTEADALATAFMVLGTERVKELVRTLPKIDVLLITDKGGGDTEIWYTPGLENYLMQ